MNAASNREKLYGIKAKLDRGEISYEDAKKEAQPLIDAINAKGLEIYKRHFPNKNPKSYKAVSFIAIMR